MKLIDIEVDLSNEIIRRLDRISHIRTLARILLSGVVQEDYPEAEV